MNNVLDYPGIKSRALKELRTTLDVSFPKTCFNLNTSVEGHCNVVKISYTDGISLTRVRNIVKGFNRPANPEIKMKGLRVEIERKMSERTRNLLLSEVKSVFNLKTTPLENDWVKALGSTAGNYIQTIFRMRDFNY